MTSVLDYIKTGVVAAGGAGAGAYTPPAGAWCRPTHRATCCIAVFNGGSCCMCVPSSATCYIIEMWGQGGGGGGGCCCGLGSYGGQGGSYGWVACTTSGVNTILCACNCQCCCSTCNICSGSPGQFSRVCRCSGAGGFWCVCGGEQGLWCCNPGYPWCWAGGVQNPTGANQYKYNTWRLIRDNSAALATAAAATVATTSALELQTCCSSQTGVTVNTATYEGCCAAAPSSGGVASGNILNRMAGALCVCSCFSSPYVWVGGCGWSDSATDSTPFGCLNNPSQGIANAQYCGGGGGVGGAAYAGGDVAWHRCRFGCGACWVQCGNFPGGGGHSTHSLSAWAQPGRGASGLILMSWS